MREKGKSNDYFMAQVYRLLPVDIQAFLERTSVLDYMTAPACNQVAGVQNADSLLSCLEQENVFVQSLGGARGLYRYHPTFRRFLLSRLSAREQMELSRTAAAYFMKSQDKLQAAEYGCRGNDPDVVLAVIEAFGEEILKEHLYSTLQRWFDFLLGQEWDLTPKARLVYGRYLWALGKTGDAREQIRMAGEAFYREGKLGEHKKALMFVAKAEREAGNLQQAEGCLPEAEGEMEQDWNDMAEEMCMERVKFLNELHFLENITGDINGQLPWNTGDSGLDRREGGKIQIQCLRQFRVTVPDADPGEVRWRTKKARELFAYLFHLQGRSISREGLIALLWPEAGEKSAAALFHTTLYSIRQAFGQERLIVYEHRKYSLNMQMVSSDLEQLRQAVREVEQNQEGPEQVLHLYCGGYMENTGYLWSYGTAKQLEDECMQVYRMGAKKRISEKREASAIPFLERILESDPYDEAAAADLIGCLIKCGKRTEARQRYNHLANRYQEDLGLDFGRTFQELAREHGTESPNRSPEKKDK